MSQLGKIEITRQDGAGNPVIAATITLRKQGATVQSGGPTSFTVDDPGGIIAGDTVNVYNADGTDPGSASVSVSSITATNVTVGGGGFSAANNTRISPSTAGPTVYRDAQGNETTTLTTDSNGYATAWVEIAPYDVVSTGGSSPLGTAPTRVWFDVLPGGMERTKSNAFMSGTTVTRIADTLRALTSGDKLISYRSAGVEKFYLDLNAALGVRLPGHNVAGLVTIDSGGLTITSGSITGPAGGLTIGGGPVTLSAGALSVTSGGVILAAGNFDTTGVTSQLRAGRIRLDRGTAHVAGDWVLGGSWGTTPINFAGGSNCRDSGGQYVVTSGSGSPGANPTVTLTFKNGAWGGGGVIYGIGARGETSAPSTAYWVNNAGAATTQTWVFVGTPTASTTYSLIFRNFDNS